MSPIEPTEEQKKEIWKTLSTVRSEREITPKDPNAAFYAAVWKWAKEKKAAGRGKVSDRTIRRMVKKEFKLIMPHGRI